jgi:hypothetical protein
MSKEFHANPRRVGSGEYDLKVYAAATALTDSIRSPAAIGAAGEPPSEVIKFMVTTGKAIEIYFSGVSPA